MTMSWDTVMTVKVLRFLVLLMISIPLLWDVKISPVTFFLFLWSRDLCHLVKMSGHEQESDAE